ncbi:hypothetical protein SB861_37720 [Paraburkholderia sp. SIMBA_049]
MGFFGGDTTVSVSSTIYNMAGDINKRPDYLKSTVTAGVLGETGASLADLIQNAYINGPGMNLRSFYRWAAGSSGYEDAVGFTAGSLVTGNSLDNVALADQIQTSLGAPAGYSVAIQSSDLGYADISWWAEQYILANHPERIETAWHCDYVNGQGVITWADGGQEGFTPAGFNPAAKYLFATYTLNSGAVDGTVVPGQTVTLDVNTGFPSTADWRVDSSVLTPTTLGLVNTVTTSHTFSDNRAPDSNTVTSHKSAQGINTSAVFEKTSYLGIDPANPKRTHSTRQIMHQDQVVSIVDNPPVTTTSTNLVAGSTSVTSTQTVVRRTQTTRLTRTYRIDTQDVTNGTQSGLQVFIYPLGSGNGVLDAMFNPPSDMGRFFPYIPVRIDNRMVSGTYKPDVYAMAKKAYKKATTKSFDDFIAKINENQSIKDIDYAYVVFGVSVNVAEITAKKYLWNFFEACMESASFTPHAYAQFKSKWAAAQAVQDVFNAWVLANGNSSVYTQAPPMGSFPALPTQSLEIRTSSSSNLNYDMVISWNGIESSFGAGRADPAHGPGDIWWVLNGADTLTRTTRVSQDPETGLSEFSFQVPYVTLYWQVDGNNWKALHIYGLTHRNYVYNGKSVDISITDALRDTQESGFIIPLNEEIFRSMSLKDTTQMSTACTYIVFNCYTVVKQPWYASAGFQVIVIIIIIIITIVTWGTGTGPAASFYGAIGAAVGLSGVAAIVVGFAITMIAAMIVSKILGYAAKKLFGEKIGAIIGAIATVVVMVVGGTMAGGGTWAEGLSQLTAPQNLLQLTAAVAQGVNQYVATETKDVLQQTNELLEKYNADMQSVADKYGSVIGSNLAYFDPMQLTDVSAPPTPGHAYVYEPADSFLNRTLMTGSDIAELNSTLIEQYVSLTLDVSQSIAT